MVRLLRWLGWTLAALVLAVAGFMTMFWAPDLPASALESRWAPPPSRFIALGGMRVHYRDEGPRSDPVPLLLLHGTSSSLHTWEGWVTTLKATRRVISVDLPGFGLTGPFPDRDFRTLRYPPFVASLLDALAVDRVVVAGNSFGGQVALETALAQPDRVDRLVLVDALAYPRNSESVPIGFVLASIPGVNRLLEYTLPRFMVEGSVASVFGDPSRVTPGLVDRYYDLNRRAGNRAALPRRFADLPTEDDARRLAGIRQPTLILWGGRDRLIPTVNGERLARDIAGSRLVLFPELGHVPQEEDPAATVAVVAAFLADEPAQ